jgi:hypothetical protein
MAAVLLGCCAATAWARELSEGDPATYLYYGDLYGDSDVSYGDAGALMPPACLPQYVDDGICDALCNSAEYGWDGKDCFHDAPECYNEPSGADYRGTVNVTESGLPCQVWFDTFSHDHTFSHLNYPYAGLGGHNLCRNPDKNVNAERPWCFVNSLIKDEPDWEYCDVPPPTSDECDETYLPKLQPTTTLTMGACQNRSLGGGEGGEGEEGGNGEEVATRLACHSHSLPLPLLPSCGSTYALMHAPRPSSTVTLFSYPEPFTPI